MSHSRCLVWTLSLCIAAAGVRLSAQTSGGYSDVVDAASQAVATCRSVPICLVPTQNVHAFLELNTETGQVWEVQYGPDVTHRVKKAINATALAEANGRPQIGRFLLWPTTGMFDFMLLDTESGRVWQVIWGNSSAFNLIGQPDGSMPSPPAR